MSIDPRARFSAVVQDYDRFRPNYPDEIVDWIAEVAELGPGAPVADVGCGTGIFTRLLHAWGLDATGIDPNREMLERAQARGGPRYRAGEAVATGLEPASVDLVTGAQSFHWFDLDRALPEFQRVLKPYGWCAAVWNLREDTPLLAEYEALLRAHSRDYTEINTPERTLQAIAGAPGIVGVVDGAFPNRQVLDREGLFGRVHSASYIAHGLSDPDAFDRALADLFTRHQSQGTVEFRYRTVVRMWRFSTPVAVG